MAFGFEAELRAEIERLRDALDEQAGRAAWHYDCLTQCEERVIQRDAEIERLRLTDEERTAIEEAADTSDVAAEFYSGKDHTRADAAAKHAATLRGLLERLGGGNE